MPAHTQERVVSYTPEQMFDVVADIESYPQFLPWCVGAKTRNGGDNVIFADMVIGFKMFRERFTTRDVLERPNSIEIAHHRGPFKHLDSRWTFQADGDGRCRVGFSIDFEFRSLFFDRMMGVVFHEAVRYMVSAFERRARAVYGVTKPAS